MFEAAEIETYLNYFTFLFTISFFSCIILDTFYIHSVGLEREHFPQLESKTTCFLALKFLRDLILRWPNDKVADIEFKLDFNFFDIEVVSNHGGFDYENDF